MILFIHILFVCRVQKREDAMEILNNASVNNVVVFLTNVWQILNIRFLLKKRGGRELILVCS